MSSTADSVQSAVYRPTADELSLERGIQVAYEATLKAGTPEAQRHAFRSLSDLAARRSPQMQEYVRSRGGR